MKRYGRRLLLTAFTLIAAPAYGASTWTAASVTAIPSAPPLDIERITVTENRSSYTLEMYLKGRPSQNDSDTRYSVFIGPADTLQRNQPQRGNSNWIQIFSDTRLIPGVIDPSGRSKVPRFRAEFTDRTNKLEWVIEKRDFATAPTQFFGATEKGFQTVDCTKVGKIVGSPIPPAAWLLASGVLSLIGLKRKQKASR